MKYLFYRSLLPYDSKDAYDRMRRGLLDLEKEIKLGKTNSDMLNKLMNYVVNDEPIVYYCDAFSFRYSPLTGDTVAIPHYTMPCDVIENYNKAIKVGLKGLVGKARAGTEEETVARLHDFICEKFTYVESDFYSHGIYGAVCRRKAVCDGIAETFKLVCDELMIASIIVRGKARFAAGAEPEPHAWNKVRVNGVWYNIDVTFDLSLTVGSNVRHDYYLLSDDEIAYSHVASEATVPCRKKGSYYQAHSLVATSAADLENIVAENAKKDPRLYIEIDVSSFCPIGKVNKNTEGAISRGLGRSLECWSASISYNEMKGTVAITLK